MVAQRPFNYFADNTNYVESYCVPGDACTFVFVDSFFRNGLCDFGGNCGSYSISIAGGGEPLVGDPAFGDTVAHNLCTISSSPSSSPSMSIQPSLSPSLSQLPTVSLVPSSSPSQEPSSMPSLSLPPTVSDAPSAPPSETPLCFTLNLVIDGFGGFETSWRVLDPLGNVVVSRGRIYACSASIVETHCVPADACTFQIFDVYGNGLNSGIFGLGSYSITTDTGGELYGDPNFGFGATHDLCALTASSSTSPSSSPSVTP